MATRPPGPADVRSVAAWLAERAALDDDARRAADAADPGAADPDANDPTAANSAAAPARLAGALLAAGRPAEALRVTACALPPREGVWWAWVAARHGTAGGTAAEQAALAATERWVAQPTDAHRRQAWAAAQAAGLETPAGGAAAAAFFTTGSLAPVESPVPVPPPPGAHATLAAGAALLAATRTDPARLGEVAAVFVAQGAEVARRLGGWDAAAAAARQHFGAQLEEHGRSVRAAAPPPASPAAPAGES